MNNYINKLRTALMNQNNILNNFDLKIFKSNDFIDIISNSDIKLEYTNNDDFITIIAAHINFLSKFDDSDILLNSLNKNEWYLLLKQNFSFIDKCNIINTNDWRGWYDTTFLDLLEFHPQLMHYLDFDMISVPSHLSTIISHYPEYILNIKPDKLKEFKGHDIENILYKQPHLYMYFNLKLVSKWFDIIDVNGGDINLYRVFVKYMNNHNIARCIAKYPNLYEYSEYYLTYKDLSSSEWTTILRDQPQFIDDNNKHIINVDDWNDIIKYQPQLIHKCPCELELNRTNGDSHE